VPLDKDEGIVKGTDILCLYNAFVLRELTQTATWAARPNSRLIVADCSDDPTNRNLWPFEFVIIALATAPVLLGAGVSVLIDRARNQQN